MTLQFNGVAPTVNELHEIIRKNIGDQYSCEVVHDRWTVNFSGPKQCVLVKKSGTIGVCVVVNEKKNIVDVDGIVPNQVLDRVVFGNYITRLLLVPSFNKLGAATEVVYDKAVDFTNADNADYSALLQRIKDMEVIVFVGGISPQLEGEEMKVDAPGFDGGDRTSILLPAVQTTLLKALKGTGKPIVFVMMTGSAVAIPWENDNIPAIVNAWYGGQSAGTAVADVLFGDYNPAGRLPVTFYKSDADLPDFNSYAMTGRTYRYFTGEPLYPFGYGLSYTSFTYDGLTLPANSKKGQPLTVRVRITNTGKVAGEEVAQLYITHADKKYPSPIRALKGFQRIDLKAGENKTIEFRLTPEDLSLVNEQGGSFQPAGKLLISVGGGQPGATIKTSSNVVTKTITIR